MDVVHRQPRSLNLVTILSLPGLLPLIIAICDRNPVIAVAAAMAEG
ncbi:hypothetical protein XM38_051480 [Halomicronema hongdechloris C2206]|uniref:Uncharacterized protein n=1 Tax=Halomicronema hongdechloris C2206 TaxID=1641165 RepID=A0A1Z3HV59_9CYAN|nr:hypothetical protein XM38_051480 [Halomicronema hongdechloris C2206]